MSEKIEYQIKITRSNNTEFQTTYDRMPEDDFGKALVAHILIRLAENLNPNLIPESSHGGDGE
jgi:hypothetical protein